MKNIDYSNQIQKEAILNECKGNLFEFLVAQRFAAKTALEDQFLIDLPSDFKLKLRDYEELIRSHDSRLLVKLPHLATYTFQSIWEDLSLESYHFTGWKVIGKLVGINESDTWNETDIVGTYKTENGQTKNLPISLKLTKDQSFTSTKSAGVKSFLQKYFSSFGQLSLDYQTELNSAVDDSYLRMGHKLYAFIDEEFQGNFDSRWTNHYPELPGELDIEMRHIVHDNYYRVALKLSAILNELKSINAGLFYDSMASLCGFGHEEIIQVNCFHNNYELKEVLIKKSSDIFSKSEMVCDILPLKEQSSSVEIRMRNLVLQVRIKPMNKFTTAAYKVNCSIKELS